MRLVRFVAQSGVCSRRNAEILIKNGEICVNNVSCIEPGYIVAPKDIITYQEKPLTVQTEHVTLMLNKPRGVISASSSPYDEETVVDCVSHDYPSLRLFPIGRLDKETSGLILLTTDGDLAYQLSHPKFEVQKKYIALIDEKLQEEDIQSLIAGIELEDGTSSFDSVETDHSQRTVTVTLHSGKNRIIRRLFAACGYNVAQLHRLEIGKLTLGSLKIGEFRELSAADIKKIQS